MKALRKTAPEFGLQFVDVDDPPAPGPGEVMIEVLAAGICGSDVHIYEWSGGYDFIIPAMPVTLGHEICGRIAATGDAGSGLRADDHVIVVPSVTCGICPACTNGDDDDCIHRVGIGMSRNGGFARRVIAPARNCLTLPAGFDPTLAALCEPMVIGARAVEVGGVSKGQRVLVLGPGTIGQAIALLSRAAGAEDVVVAGLDDRLRLDVLRQLGFDRTVDLKDKSIVEIAGAGTFDVVFEATGSPTVVQQGLSLLRKEGVLVIAGIHPSSATIDLNGLVRQQQQLRGTQRGKRRNWIQAFDFVVTQGERLAPMITHRLSLDQAIQGFELARRKQASKVMLLP